MCKVSGFKMIKTEWYSILLKRGLANILKKCDYLFQTVVKVEKMK